MVRTSGDPAALAGPLRQAAARLSPEHPLFDLQTMASVIAASVAEPRLQTFVVALFAGVGLSSPRSASPASSPTPSPGARRSSPSAPRSAPRRAR